MDRKGNLKQINKLRENGSNPNKRQNNVKINGKMVGTTRFELATSPTPILERRNLNNLAKPINIVRERETTRRNAYWTRNGPTVGPTLV
jgi:hypothetical protein